MVASILMNIFVLDYDPVRCARYHNDKHVNKMILESAQMLSTALHMSGIKWSQAYLPTHKNHGCSLWARESLSNWLWLRELVFALSDEFNWRFDRKSPHKSIKVVESLPLPAIPDRGLTSFYQAMPTKYQKIDSLTHLAYRQYYNWEKRIWHQRKRNGTVIVHEHTWTKRGQPDWWRSIDEIRLRRAINSIEQERRREAKYGV